MKLSNTAKALTIVAMFALALIASPTAKADDRGCSNATLTRPSSVAYPAWGPYSPRSSSPRQVSSISSR